MTTFYQILAFVFVQFDVEYIQKICIFLSSKNMCFLSKNKAAFEAQCRSISIMYKSCIYLIFIHLIHTQLFSHIYSHRVMYREQSKTKKLYSLDSPFRGHRSSLRSSFPGRHGTISGKRAPKRSVPSPHPFPNRLDDSLCADGYRSRKGQPDAGISPAQPGTEFIYCAADC